MSEANRLDAEIRDLRQIVSDMSESVIRLTVQLESETQSRKERTEAQERIVDKLTSALKEQINAVTLRLNTIEEYSRQLARQRGQRDPMQIAFGVIIIVILVAIAWPRVFGGL